VSQPRWLTDYFSGYFTRSLRPSLILDGKEHAVVCVAGGNYLLVLKSGRLGATAHQSLFTGQPTAKDMEKMQEKLTQADA
jgi:hypothetical protein